jgi:serine/threonine-protein kinase
MAGDDARPPMGSPKATLMGGVAVEGEPNGAGFLSATLRGLPAGESPLEAVEVDGTIGVPEGELPASAALRGTTAGRTTVLPRRQKSADPGPGASAEERARFERVRTLGQGAMGQVDLARDNDIRRTVAVKRVHAKAASPAALLRFADEVRIVGQLEHPGIVPIYDVGRDEDGQVYLVMKHLHGETMEDVIAKLRAGERGHRARFPIDTRIHIFLGVLDAIRYAHARGIVHRDLKPANVQIGPYGEVTVMDWGIARPFRRAGGPTAVEPLERTLVESHDQRLLETKMGTLAGTPLYMSPEQAAGRNDEVDDRSDVYALCVILYEWLTLEHPLGPKNTVLEVLAEIISKDYDRMQLFNRWRSANLPVDYFHVIMSGLRRERSQRYQSVAELEDAICRVRDGWTPVRCHVTLAKRVAYEFVHWLDRNAMLYTLLLFAAVVFLLGGTAFAAWRLVHRLP